MRAWLPVLVLVSSGCSVSDPSDSGTLEASDASVEPVDGGASIDAGPTSLHILDVAPPVGWQTAGGRTLRLLDFQRICGPRRGRVRSEINNLGTVLVGCQSDGGEADDHLVFRDGRRVRIGQINYTKHLLDDDSYWWRGLLSRDPFQYRFASDGGVIVKASYSNIVAANLAGWLSVTQFADQPGEQFRIVAPDGGAWSREPTHGPLNGFNAVGVGIGRANNGDMYVWKDGLFQTKNYEAEGNSAIAINAANLIAGQRHALEYRAALFWGDQFYEPAVAVGNYSYFRAVNENHVAVGTSEIPSSGEENTWGIAWAGGAAVVLDDLVRDAGYDCHIVNAYDINDHNEVVGSARCGDGGYDVDFSYYRMKLGLSN